MINIVLEDGNPKRQHRKCLNDLMSKTNGLVRIASACVTDRELFSHVNDRSIRLLISLLPMDIISGATSLETLRWLLETGVEIRVLPGRPRMHANTYIFGMSVAVITSANLTKNALESNLEVGVECLGQNLKKLTEWFDKLWRDALLLSMEHLIELQGKTARLRSKYTELREQSQVSLVFDQKQQTNGKLTDSLQNLFEFAPRFFVCNTNRRFRAKTKTGGYAIEQDMFSKGVAAAWEKFKFPGHMRLVEPGDGIFMFAKGVGIIGVGMATGKCEILSSTSSNRLWRYQNETNPQEWQIPTKWLTWVDDSVAFPYPNAPNFTFWDVTKIQYKNLRKSAMDYFLSWF
jgi:hypothetical protein